MKAIVLNRTDFREADQIITLLTLERGKISVLARGVKKIISKNSAYLEPFFLIEAEVIPGREANHLTTAIGLNSFKNIRENLQKSIMTQNVIRLTDRLLEENQADASVFTLLLNWLESVSDTDYHRTYYFGYITRLLKVLGFQPALNNCVACSKAVPNSPAAASYMFSAIDGGLKCRACFEKSNTSAKVFELTAADHVSWLAFLDNPPNLWPAEISTTLETAIMSFVEYHSGKKLAILKEIL